MEKLRGKEFKLLSEALQSAYPMVPELQRMVQFQLDMNLFNIAPWNGDLADIVFNLIQHTEAHNTTDALVMGARASNPTNDKLLRFAQKFEAGVVTPKKSELEAILNPHNIQFDIAKFREAIGEIEGRVCRIELTEDEPLGTGFLLGPDIVMTNWHVMRGAITGGGTPDRFTARFDYKKQTDGTVTTGPTYKVKEIIDSSPPTDWELKPAGERTEPNPDQLDYALIRLDGAPGDESIQYGESADPRAPLRGWIEWPQTESDDFESNKVLFVVQHPKGRTMKVTANTVEGVNENGTRVTYLNDTQEGSSGSPCFNANWELVALHHSGDPSMFPRFNQGVPLSKINALLDERGMLSELIDDDEE